jgi:hypothetical protein
MTTQDEIKKVYHGLFIIVAIGVLFMLITSVVRSCRGAGMEGWITYKRGPDNTIRTGIDGYYPSSVGSRLPPSAPSFYLVPEYRLPYDWPRGFQTEYPVPHTEPLVSIN